MNNLNSLPLESSNEKKPQLDENIYDNTKSLDDYLKDKDYKYAYEFLRDRMAMCFLKESVFEKIFVRAERLYNYTLSLKHIDLGWSDVYAKAFELSDFWKDYNMSPEEYYEQILRPEGHVIVPNPSYILWVLYILLYRKKKNKDGVLYLLDSLKKTHPFGKISGIDYERVFFITNYQLHLDKLACLLEKETQNVENTKSSETLIVTFGQYRIAKGKQTDFIRVMAVLLKLGFFVQKENGLYATNKEDVINNLSEKRINVNQLFNKAIKTHNASTIFHDMLNKFAEMIEQSSSFKKK